MTRSKVLLAACAVLLGLGATRPASGADVALEILPHLARPGITTITLRPASALAAKSFFLRVTHIGTGGALLGVNDLALDAAEAPRGIFHVVLPGTLTQGGYTGQMIDEHGVPLTAETKMTVLATQAPSISKVVPHASYAAHDRYDFELLGDNFSHDPKDNIVRINHVAIAFAAFVREPISESGRRSVKDCAAQFPCLVGNRKNLRIFGLSLAQLGLTRPLAATVQVDGLLSNENPVLLAVGDSSWPAAIAFASLAVLAGLVYLVTRGKAAQYSVGGRRYATLAYVFIEPETNTYSLSRFQLVLWTAAAVVAYVYLAASQFLVQWTWALPKVPEGLPTLLGLSAGTTALAMGTTAARGSKGAGPLHPGIGDLITTGGVFAPERLQFFIWTLLGVVGFVSATLAQDPATVTDLPKIPENFLPLMGVSSLGYLAGKVARKPGPVIAQLNPPPPYPSIAGATPVTVHIVGENLSPHAQVKLNGVLVPSDQVEPAATEPPGAEFVKELVVTAPTAVSAVPGVAAVKVINPDGQSAESSK